MAECSECGKESMSFTCKYCGEKFCSEHRLPEKHGCDEMDEKIEEEKEESQKWFQEKEVKKPAPSQKKKQRKEKQYHKPSLTGDLKRTIKNNYTMTIIGVTVAIFILQMILGNTPRSAPFYDLFVLKPGIENVIQQPWTLVTVMFLHGGFFHLFANMVTFYFFGTPVEKAIGGKKFLKFYFGAGIAASLGYVIFRNFLFLIHGSSISGLPTLGAAVGASGAVVATFAAVAIMYPEAEVLLYFFIPMKIKTALYGFAAIELGNMVAKTAGIYLPVIGGFASSAHLTGLVLGVWYGRKIREKYTAQSGIFDLLQH